MLAQISVFTGLFNRMGTNFGPLGITTGESRSDGNDIFSIDQVQSAAVGVITQPESEWVAFSVDGTIDFTHASIIIQVILFVVISSIATHMNSQASVAR